MDIRLQGIKLKIACLDLKILASACDVGSRMCTVAALRRSMFCYKQVRVCESALSSLAMISFHVTVLVSGQDLNL
jgi:hypothetical protein